ncbi:MAG: PQQ-binding-like beta-propeller repeat protein [Pirellulaceae bacterium]
MAHVKSIGIAALPLLFICLWPYALQAELRIWNDSSGKYQIEATFLRYEKGDVYLKKTDGQEIALRITKLGPAEQKWVRERLRNPVSTASAQPGEDWPAWRGPHGNSIAGGAAAPTEWDNVKNVVWKVPIPGRGHSSPVIVGDHLYLTQADERNGEQAVVCYGLRDGQEVWRRVTNSEGGFPEKIHSKNSHATPTVACVGDRLFVTFNHHDKVELTALDRATGEIRWQKDAGPFAPEQYEFGYAPSPMVHGDLVYVASEFEQGFLAAFRQSDGKEVWRQPRTSTSYSTPIVARVAGRDQLLLSGQLKISAYDPKTGKPLWTSEGPSKATCGTLVWEDDLVFASGGFPESQTMAVKADGSGEVVWANREKCYEQSMVVHNGYLYAFNDNGIALCWNAKTGEEMWKNRLGGPVSASPVIGGEHLYFTNERGSVYVVKTNPKKFERVAENRLGAETFATPTIHQGRIYHRYSERQGDVLQEYLICIAAE